MGFLEPEYRWSVLVSLVFESAFTMSYEKLQVLESHFSQMASKHLSWGFIDAVLGACKSPERANEIQLPVYSIH